MLTFVDVKFTSIRDINIHVHVHLNYYSLEMTYMKILVFLHIIAEYQLQI